MLNLIRERDSSGVDASRGYPVGTDVSYECKRCGDIVPSLLSRTVRCKCCNIEIYPEDGRVHIEYPADVRIVSESVRLADVLIRIPRRYNELGNVNLPTLLKQSGYCKAHAMITESVIREALAEHPEFVIDWQLLSEDNRSGGWYWLERSRGRFEVGYNSGKGWNPRRVCRHTDQLSACAAYIKREVEHLRTMFKL